MLARSIGWILIVSGSYTAAGGLIASFFSRQFVRLAFLAKTGDPVTLFFVRHWGILVFVVGALTVHSAYSPSVRTSVLVAAAVEKSAAAVLIIIGPAKQTGAMTAVAITDGIFAVLYMAYLAGL
jgi:hypothetical protein